MHRFKKAVIENSFFYGEGAFEDSYALMFDVTPENPQGNLTISKTSFVGLTGAKGGALYIRLWEIQDLLIESCRFIENKAKIISGDISVKFYDKIPGIYEKHLSGKELGLLKFGIRFCEFNHSSGGQAGSVLITDKSQALFYKNIFLNQYSESGGTLSASDSAEVYLFHNNFFNSSSLKDGGAVSSKNNILFIINCRFEQTKSTIGGAVQLNNVTLKLYFSFFYNTTAIEGGALYLFNSRSDLRSLEFFATKAILNGGCITLQRGYLFIEFIKINKTNSENYGGAFYISEPDSISVRNISIFHSNTKYKGVIFVEGRAERRVYFLNVYFENARANETGDCFHLTDTDILIVNLEINNVISAETIVKIDLRTVFELEGCILINSELKKSFLSALNSKVYITQFTSQYITITDTTRFFHLDMASVNFRFFKVQKFIGTQVGVFLSASKSILDFHNIIVKLEHLSLAFFIELCYETNFSFIELIQGKLNKKQK